jgi:hypothetical protein
MSKIIRFQPGNFEPFPLQVQGESNYKKSIEEIVDEFDEDDGEGVDVSHLIARLVLEDDNRYDPGNAVRVEIDNQLVGYLAKPDARDYRQRLKTLGLLDVIGECRANIKGGFAKRGGGFADYGIRLDLDLSSFQISGSPPPIKQMNMTTMPAAPKSVWKAILDWFFGPGKFRLLRILLFLFLALFFCEFCLSMIQGITGQ